MSENSILKTLIRKRGQIKSRLTSFKQYISKLDASQVQEHVEGINALSDSQIIQLEARLCTISNILDQYITLHDQIIEIDDDDLIEQRYSEFTDFENDLHEALAKAKSMLNSSHSLKRTTSKESVISNPESVHSEIIVPFSKNINQTHHEATDVNNHVVPNNASAASDHVTNNPLPQNNVQFINDNSVPSIVKLPVLKIKTFEGKTEQFPSFYESFKSLIHNNKQLDDMSRFLYLKSCLGTEASKVIEHLDVVSSNYNVALQLLEKRYTDKRLLIHNHVKGIIEFPRIIKESASSLRSLSDTFQAHLRALHSLGEPTHSWSSILQYVIIDKLNYQSKREWEIETVKLESIQNATLIEFLEKRCTLLEKIDKPYFKNSSANSSNYRFKSKFADYTQTFLAGTNFKNKCLLCKADHPLVRCKMFHHMNIDERFEYAIKQKLCTNCLFPGHDFRKCTRSHCRQCNMPHSTLLHDKLAQKPEIISSHYSKPESTSTSAVVINPVQSSPVADTPMVTMTSSIPVECKFKNTCILPTAIIFVFDFNGHPHKCTALLDSGSQRSYMTISLCNRLKLPTTSKSIPILGIGESKAKVSKVTYAKFSSVNSTFNYSLPFLLLQNITNRLPPVQVNSESIALPKGIPLANPRFDKSTKIDVLLGVDIFWKLLAVEQPYLSSFPMIYNTHLGYIISGQHTNTLPSETEVICGISTLDLSRQIQQFWEIENIVHPKLLSNEEQQCETLFVKTVKRDMHGRFIVSIPLNSSPNVLGESKQNALKKFMSLEKRLQLNTKLKNMYVDFMLEYETLGHMVEVNPNESFKGTQYFIPHHGVYKEESLTTKLRVVFNSSAPSSNGISLNDIQLNGPVLQDDLFSILIRFRRFKYVLSSDCSKMYRSVWVTESQRPLQRIFWRSDPSLPLKIYELCTVTYGEKASSFLAIRCLFELAKMCENEHSKISKIIRHDMYCDDLLTSCAEIDEGIYICDTISKILRSGGFILRKWNSNCPDLLSSVQDSDISNNILDFGPNEHSKTLGLLYNSYSDEFLFKIREFPVKQSGLTKRTVLSFISSIFDPLGLLTPCTIIAKIFIQELWMLQICWDSELPAELASQWSKYCQDIITLNDLRICRQVICNNFQSIEIHGFCDSSQKAYGACVYLRSIDPNNHIHVHLLCSKTRVAPLKTATIPKLELCGAIMLAKLVDKVKAVLDVHIDNIHYWSDSMIVLSWIKTQPHLLDTFVSNRVCQIQNISDVMSWRYVSSYENPADLLSRGTSSSNLLNSVLWWYGPNFLKQASSTWCKNPEITSQNPPESHSVVSFSAVEKVNITLFPFERFSSMSRMKRTMAYCLRFIRNCRNSAPKRHLGPLSSDELHSALILLCNISQNESFPEELKLIRSGKAISNKSRLFSLTPFFDSTHGVIRVRGRLLNASFDYEKKHPIILSAKHHLTKLLFREQHENSLHGGPQLLLNIIRDTFWPIGGRNLAKSVVRSCVKCFRVRPRGINNLLGHLPKERVTPNYPFSIVGTDYCGPFVLKDKEGRGFKTIKGYICLFICFSTRAIHLEPVTDLTTDAFILCLRNFASRRGMPKKFYSDNGRTYLGAKSELNELAQFLTKNKEELETAFANQHFNWSFLPPYSPNMAGIWEAGIKSAKFHLKRIMGKALLTFNQFYNTIVQIEGVLNSRPLSPMSDHPDDYKPLTPAHFLIGRTITSVPDPDVLYIKESRLSLYQRLQQLVQHFWNRWSKEYISELQQRTKWKITSKNIETGTLVLLKEDNSPPTYWKLGRIVELHHGNDDIVRVVSVRTQSGITRRSISKICPLPIGEEN